MSKLSDEQILALQKDVEAKQARIKLLKSKFAPETTCVYNGANLHVMKVEGLVQTLAALMSSNDYFNKACKAVNVNLEFMHQGFTFEQWKHDIIFLIDKINLKAKEVELEEDIMFLDSLVSKDTKNKQRFDALMAKYDKEKESN